MINIILAGVPGRMCREIAALALEDGWRERLQLAPVALGSPRSAGNEFEGPPGHRMIIHTVGEIRKVLEDFDDRSRVIVIDYTNPEVALGNIHTYCAAKVPFVMGTTGFDRAEGVRLVEEAGISAVIAPNMAAPIIMLQSALRHLAKEYPGAIEGWRLAIRESHQAGKKDISGTARAFLPLLESLGSTPGTPAIEAIRDPELQKILGVSDEHLGGHGWHWYALEAEDGSVRVEFSHKVDGRRVYAEGTLKAALFLGNQPIGLGGGRVFSMEDVLKG